MSATSLAGAPGLLVAVKTSGASPATVTVIWFTPTRGPMLQIPTGVDGPSFVTRGASARMPLPADTVMETATPCIGRPRSSFTTKAGVTGSFCPATPICASPMTTEIAAALGGEVVS